ncbi:hypothetical protein [Thalassotalea profundi]|uniref:Lipoprotein n=1 Tax=Thalassotalea profundi TaxID=2036687 RepID=A0ABQ3IQS3_9GAMM|nr:hypothetical protein [Thalassotalea profundi]GHE89062.1 hypothetical protein GCM10011501_18140 [Thalassotalea profundi]
MMKWLYTCALSLLFIGCSNTPNYHNPAPDTCDGAPGCAASAILSGILQTEPAPKKCSQMSGHQKEKCDAQVEAVKASIKKHSESK